MESGKRKQLEQMLTEFDDLVPNTCLAHSGINATLKFLITDSIAKWDVIRAIDNRLWGLVIGVAATFGLVLLQLIVSHAK